HRVPVGRSHRCLADRVFESSLLGISHTQGRAASRSDVPRADVGVERVDMIRLDRNNLIYGLIFIVTSNFKVNTQAASALVSPGSCEIKSEIGCRAGPPIKSRVQWQLLETAIKDQVVLHVGIGTFNRAPALEVLPHMRGLLDSARTDQALEVRLNRREGKGPRVCCDERPNVVGCVVLSLSAQAIYEAHLDGRLNSITISQHLLKDDVGLEHS